MVRFHYMHALTASTSTHPLFPVALLAILLPLIIVAVLWTIVLKGFALWYAARGGQKGWFIALLIINTLGILELVYLIWFRPKGATPASETLASPVSKEESV
jgi:methionyl-tRNA synthetase